MLRVEQCEEVMKSSSLEVSRTEEFCFFLLCVLFSRSFCSFRFALHGVTIDDLTREEEGEQ